MKVSSVQSTVQALTCSEDLSAELDAAFYARILRMDAPTVIRRLATILGREITAELAGVKDVRTISSWMKAASYPRILGPSPQRLKRLRVALRFAYMLSQHERYSVVAAWFSDGNPYLPEHESPLQVITQGDFAQTTTLLVRAAQTFIGYAVDLAGELPPVKTVVRGSLNDCVTVRIVAQLLSPIVAAYIAGGVSTATIEQWSREGGNDRLAQRKLRVAYDLLVRFQIMGLSTDAQAWFHRSISAPGYSPSADPATMLHQASSRNVEHIGLLLVRAVEIAIAS